MAVFCPGESSDDCYVFGTDIWLDVHLQFGRVSASFDTGVKFNNINIPKESIILTAIVTFQANDSGSGTTCNAMINGEDIDNAVTFSTYANYAGRARTAEHVHWNSIGAWTADTYYDSPDIANIIQEIINRPLWIYGNDLALFFADDGSDTNALRIPKSYDDDPSLPKLTVTWAPAPSHFRNNIMIF